MSVTGSPAPGWCKNFGQSVTGHTPGQIDQDSTVYDIHAARLFALKDQGYGLPVKWVSWIEGGSQMAGDSMVLSADKKVIKIWDQNMVWCLYKIFSLNANFFFPCAACIKFCFNNTCHWPQWCSSLTWEWPYYDSQWRDYQLMMAQLLAMDWKLSNEWNFMWCSIGFNYLSPCRLPDAENVIWCCHSSKSFSYF